MFGSKTQTIVKTAFSISDAKKYRDAFEALGAEVEMEVWGVCETQDGELAFLGTSGAPVLKLGRLYAEAMVDGRPTFLKIDVGCRIAVRGIFQ